MTYQPHQSEDLALKPVARSATPPASSAAPATAGEPWMTSYSAIPRATDGTDYIITTVAAKEFQLYRHEAAHLHALLGKALAADKAAAPTAGGTHVAST